MISEIPRNATAESLDWEHEESYPIARRQPFGKSVVFIAAAILLVMAVACSVQDDSLGPDDIGQPLLTVVDTPSTEECAVVSCSELSEDNLGALRDRMFALLSLHTTLSQCWSNIMTVINKSYSGEIFGMATGFPPGAYNTNSNTIFLRVDLFQGNPFFLETVAIHEEFHEMGFGITPETDNVATTMALDCQLPF